jgi:hypothetical protein
MAEIAQASTAPSRGWIRARRALTSVLVVIATIFVGLLVGESLASLVRDARIQNIFGIPIKWGLAGVGVAYILGSLEKVLKVINTFREYVAQPDKKVSLYPDCVALACIIAYLTVLANVLPDDDSRKALEPQVRKELVYLMTAPEAREVPVEYFPFTFTLAKGPADWKVGTELGERQIADLEALVKSLRACVGKSAGQDVEVATLGYADTNEFPSNSDELNRQTANRRAADLYRHLVRLVGTQAGASKLLVRPLTEWPKDDPKAMTRERYFATKGLKETQGADQGLFNRRADLLVYRLGACQRLTKG